jgi:hypothetical protein
MATIADRFLGHELGNGAVVPGAVDDNPVVGALKHLVSTIILDELCLVGSEDKTQIRGKR